MEDRRVKAASSTMTTFAPNFDQDVLFIVNVFVCNNFIDAAWKYRSAGDRSMHYSYDIRGFSM